MQHRDMHIADGMDHFDSLCGNFIGRTDLRGRALQVTQTGFADELASAASLLMGQADEQLPAVIISGLGWDAPNADARSLIRPKEEDLFR